MRFNRNELSIMKYLWSATAPLSRSEIIEGTPDRPWSPDSFHMLINKLMRKGAIKVDGYITSTGHLGKNYAPAISPDEYLRTEMESVSRPLSGMVAAFLGSDDVSVAQLEAFREMIDKRLVELKKK